MKHPDHPTHWLHHANQHLGLVPSLGGGAAAWQIDHASGVFDLWRPWAGDTDRYTLASFPLVPWSNRISAGGIDHAGIYYPMKPNRVGEPYPIHGDGWLQSWDLHRPAENIVEMMLDSKAFSGNPYAYFALQRFVLLDGGMDQTLTVTHKGIQPLPYGLGQHPFFQRSPMAQLTAQVQGVWLSGADPLPTAHTINFPSGWDPRAGMNVDGDMVDNVYTGWSGQAGITWPEHQLTLTLSVPEIQTRGLDDGYCLLYRPPFGQAFCFEPVTHPIDAFHLPNQPGLRVLHTGESLTLRVEWRFSQLSKTGCLDARGAPSQ